MKRKEFLKYLRSQGCDLLREGARHSWWHNPAQNKRSAIPRHGEIKDILDAAPAKLLQLLTCKAEEAGMWVAFANTKIVKPTQRCHLCGALVAKALEDREHICSCGCHTDRNLTSRKLTFPRNSFHSCQAWWE